MSFLKKIVALIVLSAIVYAGGVYYFNGRFLLNTKFGDIEVGGLTLAQASQKIQTTLESKTIAIHEKDKEIASVTLKDLEKTYALDNTLKAKLNEQNSFLWGPALVEPEQYEGFGSADIQLDTAALEKTLATQGIDNAKRQAPQDAVVKYTEEDGYHVVGGEVGTQVDFRVLGEQLVEGASTVRLEDSYTAPKIDKNHGSVTSKMGAIDKVADINITLQIADEDVQIPRKTIENWLYFDDEQNVLVDESLVREYVQSLEDTYNTFGKTRTFQSTLQGTVEVPPGILGWGIDVEVETANLLADLDAGKDVKREPATYSTGGIANAKDDIGGTYIEVDITHQMMYLYVDNEPVVSSNVVTGQPAAPTTPGANAIIEMLRDTELTGVNHILNKEYKVPVQYWMRFDYNAQGIHDASWQSSFGGDTHLWSGSLGCVNTPIDVVAYIYETVDYGTPVIVFY
ncbi:MAG: peptidoglycan binding domain-containing protein [Aerococcaceae bacterium]|nr:peptidoglycan binding domain-containing protein [Aerococcaceae bacterium]